MLRWNPSIEARMDELEYLRQVDLRSLPQLRPILLDDLYSKVRQNLHLEIGLGPTLFMLSPSYSILNPVPPMKLSPILSKKMKLSLII